MKPTKSQREGIKKSQDKITKKMVKQIKHNSHRVKKRQDKNNRGK